MLFDNNKTIKQYSNITMSRIGKKPIQVPDMVDIKLEDQKIIVKGPKGELSLELDARFDVEMREKELIIHAERRTGNWRAQWGLTRSLISNMIKGVTEGFKKKLEIHGVGYRARLEENYLILDLGFSRPVRYSTPSGIEFSIEKNTVVISGIDKQQVGQVAAEIRAKKKPEPYKGKGIRYVGEVVRRKAGKKAAGTAA